MPLKRDDKGIWTLEARWTDRKAINESHPSYLEALPRYLTALDVAFDRAKRSSEFNFLLSIFAVRGLEDAGWDPYETTMRAIKAVRGIHSRVKGEASRHLALWLYGHIVEASEPYEFLANIIDIAVGGSFLVQRFPVMLSPGKKIGRLEVQAVSVGMPDVVVPMKEAWNRDFRNAIFHADYSFHGDEVRTVRPPKRYSHDHVMTLVNRALAYNEAMSILRRFHIESYTEPATIPVDPRFSPDPNERAVVIVRKEYGATGIKDAWSLEERRRGHIPYRLGRFSDEETAMLDADPTLASLPAHPRAKPELRVVSLVRRLHSIFKLPPKH